MKVTDKDFRWNDFNLGKIAKHAVTQREAENVVRFAKHPYPRRYEKTSWIVVGRAHTNRMIRVLFFIDQWDNIYVYHAMPVR